MAAPGWVCCQLGAREHYVMPRALHRQRRLAGLITDAWVKPGSLLRLVPGGSAIRLRERYHPDLAAANVEHFTASLLAREIGWRSASRTGWDLFARRNQWFQHQVAGRLARRAAPSGRPVLLAHSYAALDIFRWAKPRGWTLVLAQIDPGEEHFRIVAQSAAAAPEFGPPPEAPPPGYLDAWREETRLADHIVVNSEWTRECLERAGVPGGKITVAPLAYEPQDAGEQASIGRRYPEAFTWSRPLRLLFVGQVAVAKGAGALLGSTDLLSDVPFELTVVGAAAMQIPRRYRDHPALRWVGPVPRGEVMRRYREADILVFPSLSDGFGMAQVEAQGWGLPILASRNCGRVVREGINGLLLPEVSAAAIAAAVRTLAGNPGLLSAFAEHATPGPATAIDALGRVLTGLEPS